MCFIIYVCVLCVCVMCVCYVCVCVALSCELSLYGYNISCQCKATGLDVGYHTCVRPLG